jgi:hypothetical protein
MFTMRAACEASIGSFAIFGNASNHGTGTSTRIVAHHHGALLPTYAKRFDSLLALGELSGDVLATKISRPYIDHFKKFYCDTAAFG